MAFDVIVKIRKKEEKTFNFEKMYILYISINAVIVKTVDDDEAFKCRRRCL